MPDPFEVLKQPIRPITPNPQFANRLRARLERQLYVPEVSMSAISAQLQLRHGDIAYTSLWVPDVERAATFFASVLGWTYQAGNYPQSRHVTDAVPHQGLAGGQQGDNMFLAYAVEDLARAVERVRAAGGTAVFPSYTSGGDLVADCVDNQGVQFAIGETGSVERHPGPGDLAYATLQVVDSAKARNFYGAVLGWEFTSGRIEDGWNVANVRPMVGMSGGHDRAAAIPLYQVVDIGAAVARVRAAGGTATDPERQPYGITSDCSDGQGTRFYLAQF